MICQGGISLDADCVIVINGECLLLNSWDRGTVLSAPSIRNHIFVSVNLASASGSWESSRGYFEALRTVLIRVACAVEGNCLDVGYGTDAPLLGLCCDDLPVVRHCPLIEEDATYDYGDLAC
jgi:hypothetical protein